MNLQKVESELKPVLEKAGFEIVDIELAKKYGQDHLTLFIAKEPVVSLDDTTVAYNLIDPILEQLNPSADKPYVLNVSSPGLDRPFKKQRDFERNYNKKVEVKLYAPLKGKKLYEGVLLEKRANTILIELFSGESLQLELSKIALVRPYVSFD